MESFRNQLNLFCLLTFIVAMACGPSAVAQRYSGTADDWRLLPVDHAAGDLLQALLENQRNGRDDAVLDSFRALTTGDPFALISAADDNSAPLPAFRLVHRTFHQLSPAHQTLLRDSASASAQQELRRAVEEEDWKDLVVLIHHFPGTHSSYAAQLLLARRHLDAGHRLAADVWLNDLEIEGIPHRFQRAAANLRGLNDSASRVRTTPNDITDAPAVLPSNTRWTHGAMIGDAFSRQIESAIEESSGIPSTAWNAIVDSGSVYRRTLRGVAALDAKTGSIRWHFRVSPAHLDAVRTLTTGRQHINAPGMQLNAENAVSPAKLASIFLDSAQTARVALDRRHVYTVIGMPSARIWRWTAAQSNGQLPMTDCRLVALDRSTGRRVWTAGGSQVEPALNPGLMNVWFAGAPAVHQSRLHCLVEQNGEFRCVTLRNSTGEVAASTLLAFPERPIEQDVLRRHLGLTPVFHEGLIICPTGMGWIAAVDSLTQSIAWTVHTSTLSPDASVTRASAEIHIQNGTALVLPANSGEMMFVDLATGDVNERRAGRHTASVLGRIDNHEDPGFIVAWFEQTPLIGNPARSPGDTNLERLSTTAHRTVWKRRLTDPDEQPSGPGIVRGDELLLTATSGMLLTLNTETGDVSRRLTNIVPAPARGQLVSTEESSDLLLVSPTKTIALTSESLERPEQNGVDQARELFRDGQPDDAWTALQQATPREFDRRPAAALRFRIAVTLALQNRLPGDVTLEDLSSTPDERRLARVIDLRRRLEIDPAATARAVLTLAQDASAQLELIPGALLPTFDADEPSDAARLSETSPLSGYETRRQVSMELWMARMMMAALDRLEESGGNADAAAAAELLGDIRSLPTDILLHIDDPMVADTIRERLLSEPHPETALHLLHRATELFSDRSSDDVADGNLPSWNELPAGTTDDSDEGDASVDFQVACRKWLLAAIADESATPFSSRLTPLDAPKQLTTLLNEERQRQAEWIYNNYRTIPIARSVGNHQRPFRVQTRHADDAFLRLLSASVYREPSRLLFTKAGSAGGPLLSVPCPLGGDRSRSGAWIQRSGSLLLVTFRKSLTAVSLLDERMLWNRELAAPVRYSMPWSFAPDSPGLALMSKNDSYTRLAGSGFRWVCVQTPDAVEMVDALTGTTTWSFSADANDHCIASDDLVLVFHQPNPPAATPDKSVHSSLTALDRRTGSVVDTVFQASQARLIICGAGTDFAVWEPGDRKPGGTDQTLSRLVWKNGRTGTVTVQQQFPDAARCQFADSRTLAVTDKDGRVSIINLLTRAHSDYDGSADSAVASDAEPETAKNAWDVAQMQVRQDAHFVYLLDLPVDRLDSGTSGEIACRRVRVIDRATGATLWESEKLTNGSIVMDEPGLPFVVLLEKRRRDPTQNTVIHFTCRNRRSGKILLSERIPMRNVSGNDQRRISAHDDFSISAEIHGSRFLFERD